VISFLFFVLLILGSYLQAMEKHQTEVKTALQNLEKKMKVSIENKQHLYQELEQLKKVRSRLFDEALVKDNMPAGVALLRDGGTIGLCSMYKTKEFFHNASPLMKVNVVHTIASYIHQSENRRRLLWILASLGDEELEFTKSFFAKLPKEKHRKYLNMPVWSAEGLIEGYTPLYMAAEKLHLQLATYLIDQGADGSLHPLSDPTVQDLLSPFGIEVKPVELSEKDFTSL
jgi:hypothetical protein